MPDPSFGANQKLPYQIRILRASGSFRIARKAFPGFPMPCGPKGLVLPIVDYLLHRARFQNPAVGTLIGEARIIANWFVWLRRRGRSWKRPDDDLIIEWRNEQESAHAKGTRSKIGLQTIARKTSVIFKFYYITQVIYGRIVDVIGEPRGQGQTPYGLLVWILRSKKGGRRIVPLIQYSTIPESRDGRLTPDRNEASGVLERLFERPDHYASATHWFLGSWMYRCGLRAAGVAGLSVSAIADGLRKEGICRVDGQRRKRPLDLAAIAGDFASRGALLGKLYKLEDKCRKNVFVKVTEKNSVTRSVAVPIPFMIEVLGHIWEQRHIFLTGFSAKRPDYQWTDALYPSKKTGGFFKPNSVTNILKEAFNKEDLDGSGHRLRAAYAYAVMRDAYLRARSAHGRNWDSQTVLHLVAEALGHKNLNSLRSYLNDIMREDQVVEGHPVLVEDRTIWTMVVTVVNALNAGSVRVGAEFEAMFKRLALEPVEEDDSLEAVRTRVAERMRAHA